MNFTQIKKLSINVMIGSLVGAAVVAVIAVLVGSFNETLGRALFTLLIVGLHALASLGFLETRSKLNEIDTLNFFTNTVFVIIVLSFLTSIFGIWQLFAPELVGKLYSTYFIAAFASLHGEMLARTLNAEVRINNIVYANYIFMGIVILLLLPLVWLSGDTFGNFYYRLLAATGIVDATLTILAVILHKLYLQKHPKVVSQLFTVSSVDANGNLAQATAMPQTKRSHPLLILLGIYLLVQVFGSVFYFVFSL